MAVKNKIFLLLLIMLFIITSNVFALSEEEITKFLTLAKNNQPEMLATNEVQKTYNVFDVDFFVEQIMANPLTYTETSTVMLMSLGTSSSTSNIVFYINFLSPNYTGDFYAKSSTSATNINNFSITTNSPMSYSSYTFSYERDTEELTLIAYRNTVSNTAASIGYTAYDNRSSSGFYYFYHNISKPIYMTSTNNTVIDYEKVLENRGTYIDLNESLSSFSEIDDLIYPHTFYKSSIGYFIYGDESPADIFFHLQKYDTDNNFISEVNISDYQISGNLALIYLNSRICTPGSNHYYRIIAINSDGETVASSNDFYYLYPDSTIVPGTGNVTGSGTIDNDGNFTVDNDIDIEIDSTPVTDRLDNIQDSINDFNDNITTLPDLSEKDDITSDEIVSNLGFEFTVDPYDNFWNTLIQELQFVLTTDDNRSITFNFRGEEYIISVDDFHFESMPEILKNFLSIFTVSFLTYFLVSYVKKSVDLLISGNVSEVLEMNEEEGIVDLF